MIKIDKQAIERKVAQQLAIIMREETDDAFRQKAFNGEPWVPTGHPVANGSLMLRTGLLRRSFAFIASGNRVIVTSAVPYAALHNEGGVVTVPVTERMRRYFFYMYKKTKEDRYRAMALSRKQSYRIRIPKRQFVGIQPSTIKKINDSLKLLEQ